MGPHKHYIVCLKTITNARMIWSTIPYGLFTGVYQKANQQLCFFANNMEFHHAAKPYLTFLFFAHLNEL